MGGFDEAVIPIPGLKNGGFRIDCSYVGRLDAGSTHSYFNK